MYKIIKLQNYKIICENVCVEMNWEQIRYILQMQCVIRKNISLFIVY